MICVQCKMCCAWTYSICIFLRSTERLGNTTDDQRLLNYLLQDYKNRRLVRPVKDRSKAVVIGFSAELIGVAKVVRKKLKSWRIFKSLRL